MGPVKCRRSAPTAPWALACSDCERKQPPSRLLKVFVLGGFFVPTDGVGTGHRVPPPLFDASAEVEVGGRVLLKVQAAHARASLLRSESSARGRSNPHQAAASATQAATMDANKCKVLCQRFGMKALGPQFEGITDPTVCVRKCDDVYGGASAALLAATSLQNTSMGRGVGDVLHRMEYWAPGGADLPPGDSFVLFSIDIGGLNNIRLGLEMTALVAQYTGRTLVLPPASPMYLLDWGPVSKRYMDGHPPNNARTLLEDIINLPQLKSRLPTLTWNEFCARTGLDWDTAMVQANTTRKARCNLPAYAQVQERILFLGGDASSGREGFSCAEWWKHGAPIPSMQRDMGQTGWALLQHAFVWHPDAFDIAAEVVRYLGMFSYNAVHMRENDFQYVHPRASNVVDGWGAILAGTSTLYVATDDPSRVRDSLRLDGVRVVSWDDLFEESTGRLLAGKRARFTEERWFKLTGLVEELICTYAKIFVGSRRSSFSGHIDRMRLQTSAPVTLTLTLDMDAAAKRGALDRQLSSWRPEMMFKHNVPAEEGVVFLQAKEEGWNTSTIHVKDVPLE